MADKIQVVCNLETYCDFWNLKVNLNKLKIMIFRKGGKLYSDDNSFYNRMELVNKYKYLGVTLILKFSWDVHLKDKHVLAKLLINILWRKIDNKVLCLYLKFVVGMAPARKIMGLIIS